MGQIKDFMIQYSKDVINGDVAAGQKHKWACERFLRDVEREETDEFPYVFSEKKALHFLKWMTLFKHRKGKLAGQHIKPAPIQIFVFGNIYGWIHKGTGFRRFKYGYWQVGRKNAKSQSLACVGSYEASALGESSSEVYVAATKRDQAKIVWEETDAMIQGSDFLRDKFKTAYGRIKHPKSDSVIAPLSKEDRKKGDGYNPQAGIIDEYHAHETSEMYDIIDSGMGARLQPLLMIITTAGFELNNPCYRVEYKYVSKILNPNIPVENEEYFVMINELDENDDTHDREVWIKANPILASYDEGMQYLERRFKKAQDEPEKMRDFLTKNMNKWVNMRENGYMDMNKWAICGKKKFPDLRGKPVIVGIDLSKKIDLTSVSFEFSLGNGEFAVKSHSFMPEDTLEEKRKTDRVPYGMWAEKGWITATPGAVVDYSFVKHYIKKFAYENEWSIQEICYDPYNATQLAQDMEADGYTMVEIRQGMQTLSEPTNNFRELVISDKIYHDGNPVLTWAIGNAVTKMAANESIQLDKAKSTNRIDPIASLINAHVRAMVRSQEVDLNAYILSEDFSF